MNCSPTKATANSYPSTSVQVVRNSNVREK